MDRLIEFADANYINEQHPNSQAIKREMADLIVFLKRANDAETVYADQIAYFVGASYVIEDILKRDLFNSFNKEVTTIILTKLRDFILEVRSNTLC